MVGDDDQWRPNADTPIGVCPDDWSLRMKCGLCDRVGVCAPASPHVERTLLRFLNEIVDRRYVAIASLYDFLLYPLGETGNLCCRMLEASSSMPESSCPACKSFLALSADTRSLSRAMPTCCIVVSWRGVADPNLPDRQKSLCAGEWRL